MECLFHWICPPHVIIGDDAIVELNALLLGKIEPFHLFQNSNSLILIMLKTFVGKKKKVFIMIRFKGNCSCQTESSSILLFSFSKMCLYRKFKLIECVSLVVYYQNLIHSMLSALDHL